MKIPIFLIYLIVFLIITLSYGIINLFFKYKTISSKLLDSDDSLRTLLDTVPIPIFYKDINGKYTDCNKAFEEYIGFSRNEILNKDVTELFPNDLAKTYHLADLDLMANKSNQTYESELPHRDGEIHHVIFKKSAITLKENVIGIVGVILDITEQKNLELNSSRLSEFKDAMIDINQALISLPDISELFTLILRKSIDTMRGAKYGSILLLNPDNTLRIAAYCGYSPEKVREFSIPLEESFHYLKTNGNISETIIIDDVDELYKEHYLDVANLQGWSIKSSISTPIVIKNRLFGMLNIDSNEKNIFGNDDIELMNYMKTQIESAINTHELYRELIFLSKFDSLTGLLNRRYFEDAFKNILSKALRYDESFCLVVFDLNDLKKVNDVYGHQAGDEYLKHITSHIKTSARSSDIIARYGGDEFIAIYFNADSISLSQKFDDLNDEFLSNPMVFESNDIYCSFSYGISDFPTDSTEYNELIKIADERMYAYKTAFKSK